MSVHLAAFFIGLFGVPLALLGYSHRLRKRSARSRAVFWGAVIGHCVAGGVAVILGMIPPEAWTSDEYARGFAGFWSLLIFPAAGALAGAALRGATSRP